MAEVFTMPINGDSFTWHPNDADRAQARSNHAQTLERLKERGGMSWCELCAVLEGRWWKRMDSSQARQRCFDIVASR